MSVHHPSHDHSHPHHAHSHPSHPLGTRHPAAAVAPSLLRLSALARLMMVLPVVALLWAAALAVLWGAA
ncbi:hypothetical protein [Ancylobacter oerskovii]|uniref:Uncharacterized protein n=1 Tax=Ancylobacter oerskovii TaxID=459519 RepID=A0ABW4YSC9_9HYPH|nr:hypothetical protein [Ancylobacter oerskovii]MBS7545340.1 hypothetical protein [Ancylobacter oerskovii]